MDRPPASVPTAPVRRPDRWPGRLVIAALVLVVVAIVKPWPTDPTATGPGPDPSGDRSVGADRGVDVAAEPAASVTPDALSPGAVPCRSPDGWRVVTTSPWLGQLSHSWIAAEPVMSAGGPTDPSIPFVNAGPAPVLELGACAPRLPSGGAQVPGPPTLVVGAWRLADPAGAVAEPLAVATAMPVVVSAAAAQLYGPAGGPATDPSGEPPVWQAGRYVLELRSADPATTAWMGVTIGPASATVVAPSARVGPGTTPDRSASRGADRGR